jgi:hypothetical protein
MQHDGPKSQQCGNSVFRAGERYGELCFHVKMNTRMIEESAPRAQRHLSVAADVRSSAMSPSAKQFLPMQMREFDCIPSDIIISRLVTAAPPRSLAIPAELFVLDSFFALPSLQK